MSKDILGTFEVEAYASFEPQYWAKCGSCHRNVPTAVTYQQLEFAEKYVDIKPESTLFKKGMTFGIECGCFGKLHRQIAHIHDKMERTNSYG